MRRGKVAILQISNGEQGTQKICDCVRNKLTSPTPPYSEELATWNWGAVDLKRPGATFALLTVAATREAPAARMRTAETFIVVMVRPSEMSWDAKQLLDSDNRARKRKD